jgi:uncharacterized protein
MLRIDLAEVRAGPVRIAGELAPQDPLLADTGIGFAAVISVYGRMTSAGEGKYFWHGRLETVVHSACRRCLAEVNVPVNQELRLVFAEEGQAAEDYGCYLIARGARTLDLAPIAREEAVLAAPQYVQCRDDCRGLCPRCGANLNEGPCGCEPD